MCISSSVAMELACAERVALESNYSASRSSRHRAKCACKEAPVDSVFPPAVFLNIRTAQHTVLAGMLILEAVIHNNTARSAAYFAVPMAVSLYFVYTAPCTRHAMRRSVVAFHVSAACLHAAMILSLPLMVISPLLRA
jgi:hypothetical protein